MPVSITTSWDRCLVFKFPVSGNFRLRTNSGWLSNIIVFDDEALGMCERCRPDSVWNCACLSGPGEYSLSALQGRLRAAIFRFPALRVRLGIVNRERPTRRSTSPCRWMIGGGMRTVLRASHQPRFTLRRSRRDREREFPRQAVTLDRTHDFCAAHARHVGFRRRDGWPAGRRS